MYVFSVCQKRERIGLPIPHQIDQPVNSANSWKEKRWNKSDTIVSLRLSLDRHPSFLMYINIFVTIDRFLLSFLPSTKDRDKPWWGHAVANTVCRTKQYHTELSPRKQRVVVCFLLSRNKKTYIRSLLMPIK